MAKNIKVQQVLDEMADALFGSTPVGHCVSCKLAPVQGANMFTEAGTKEFKLSRLCEQCWNEMMARWDEPELGSNAYGEPNGLLSNKE